ncbi:MAG: GNAT family N-acetyltransferase [Candidatus Thermoplasmatota archaeon]|nr:GNAT family N-acetyltransferase [Candidatus Thermoplasmatota archaeon]
MNVKSLDGLSVAEVVDLFNQSFSDYIIPMKETETGFKARCQANSIDLANSFYAEVKGRPAGVVMLAHRDDEGWVGGMGVLPEFRRMGAADVMLDAIAEAGRRIGLERIWLEVIIGNEPAYLLYKKFGFKETRALSCFRLVGASIPNRFAWAKKGDELAKGLDMHCSTVSALSYQYDHGHCWQKRYETISKISGLEAWLLSGKRGQGYAVMSKQGKRVEVFDLSPAEYLMPFLSRICEKVEDVAEIRTINAHRPDMVEAYRSAGFEEFLRQREMVLEL